MTAMLPIPTGAPVQPTCRCRFDIARARALYGQGLADGEIADELGVDKSSVCRWRARESLPALRAGGGRRVNAIVARELYDRGFSDALIAARLDVAERTVTLWRRGEGLPTRRGESRGREDDGGTYAMIDSAVPRWIMPELRQDVIGTIYLAVLEGDLPLWCVRQEAPRYARRISRDLADKWGPLSLDEAWTEGGESWVARLVDPSAEEAFDVALERAWDHRAAA